jgi:hypothetical protein
VAYKQPQFISHSSGDGEVPDQGSGTFGAGGKEPTQWLIDGYLLTMSSLSKRGEEHFRA